MKTFGNGMRNSFRRIAYPLFDASPLLRVTYMALRPRQRRSTSEVNQEYSNAWTEYASHLESAAALEDWICVSGVDDPERNYLIDGTIRRQRFFPAGWATDVIEATLRKEFPEARSVTEYGCGLGRKLLDLKRRMPHVDFYGYELTDAGVELGRKAAKKFGVQVEFSQLDYVHDPPSKFRFPTTDVAFTAHSLEQIPLDSMTAMRNILARVRLGTIHKEPVKENFPLSFRGMLGRIYCHKQDYLRDFDSGVRKLGLRSVSQTLLRNGDNPLVYPSLYVLKV